jgi:hypothetical protein
MNQLLHFLGGTEVGHFILYMTGSAAIGSMPAPTATSSQFYLWAFRFLNTMASNLTRAFNTKVERSPNFADAVQKGQDLGTLPKS